MNLIFRLRHIIKQKFKNQCTSKPASFNLKIRKSHWHVNILYIIYTDESGIFHCLGKAVTVTAIRRSTVKLRGRISEILTADGFITSLSVLTAEPAAFIAQEFYFIFLVLRHQLVYRILYLTGSPVQYNGNLLGLLQLENPENLSELLWLKR